MSWRLGFFGLCVGIAWMLFDADVFAAPSEQPKDADDAARFAEKFQPLLERHCMKCHQGEQPKGKFRLDSLSADFADVSVRRRWSAVVERVTAGEMPPEDEPKVPADDIRALSEWVTPRIQAAETAARAAQGRTVLRRLNRVEYENTINDLLGIQAKVQKMLPQDGAADGFDNAGAALHTSSFLLEKYLEAADLALDLAIANRAQRPPLIDQKYSLKDGHPVKGSTEDVYRFGNDGEVICFCSSEWHNVSISPFYPPDPGMYRFRISASAIQSKDKPVTFRVTQNGARLTGKSGLIGYFDASPDKPKVFEFIRYMDARTTISILPYGLAHANTVNKVGGEKWDGPGLAVQSVEITGPLYDSWPSPSHRQLFGNLEQKKFPSNYFNDYVEVISSEPRTDAERILTDFARRAFRRAVTADEVAPFVAVAMARLEQGSTFEQALRAAFKGVLISPDFLFLREQPGTLDDFALASRLSYFLWSTMPDDELLSIAERHELSRPEVLRAQVERMLAHPRAAAFTDNFTGQWLSLREIDATEPSGRLYPEFDHLLKVSMIRETELFFDEILRNDLSVTNFVASDFTMLNGRLAKHYGIPGPDGWEFKKTAVPSESHRGGVMTMASVLKVTANGTTTSPVTRGAWVLDRILGTPPKPPPADIATIVPDIRGATTIREQLAKHRSVETCAACHRHIDPPGFALENFDCIGLWRDYYRVTDVGKEIVVDGRLFPYRRGKDVDATGVTADGEAFNDIDQLKQLLLRDKPQLARAVTRKLITYATGRAPQTADQPAVEAIVARVAVTDYGLRSIVHEVVQSDLFRQK